MEFSSVVVDGICLLIIVLCAVRAHKQGFATAVVNLLGKFVRLFVGMFASDKLSPLIFQKMRPSMITRVMEYFESNIGVIEIGSILDRITESWPERFGFLENISGKLPSFLALNESGARWITDNIVAPFFTECIGAVVFIVCFVLVSLLCNFLGRALKIVNKVPIVGGLNRILGVLVGIVSGCLNIILLSFLLSIIVVVSKDALPFINSRTLAGSKILALTGAINPFFK